MAKKGPQHAGKCEVLQQESSDYHFLRITNISKSVRIHSFVRIFLKYKEFKAMVLRLEEGDTEKVADVRFSTKQVSPVQVSIIFMVFFLLLYYV